MPKKSTDELRRDLAAETNPEALHRMTATQLAELAGANPTPAAANALHMARNYPATFLFVSAAALRPALLPRPALTLQPANADHGQTLVEAPPAIPTAADQTTAASPPAPAPLANLDSLANE